MPTYAYQCKSCGYQMEELQSFNEPPLVRCPSCHKDTLARVIGSGGGLIFKGSGFYLTDYKKSEPSTKKKDETKKADPSPAAPPSSESKPSEDTKTRQKKKE